MIKKWVIKFVLICTKTVKLDIHVSNFLYSLLRPTNLYLFNFEFKKIYKYGGPSAANKLFCDFKNIVVFTHNKLWRPLDSKVVFVPPHG